MPCDVCQQLTKDQLRAVQTLVDAQNELDRCIAAAASVAEYRRLRTLLSDAKISARLAELQADQHARNCHPLQLETFQF